MEFDILGRELKPNQVVAYPVQTKQGLRLGVGVVTEILVGSVRILVTRKDGGEYNFTFTRLDRLVITEDV